MRQLTHAVPRLVKAAPCLAHTVVSAVCVVAFLMVAGAVVLVSLALIDVDVAVGAVPATFA